MWRTIWFCEELKFPIIPFLFKIDTHGNLWWPRQVWLAYFEHQVAWEHSSSTAAELPVCTLLISCKCLCPCQDTVPWWVPRSVLKWVGSGLEGDATDHALLTDKLHHKACGWERVTLCNNLHKMLWRIRHSAVNFSFSSTNGALSDRGDTMATTLVRWGLEP